MADETTELTKIPTSNQSLPHGVLNKNAEVTNNFIKLFPTFSDEDKDSFLRIVGASGLEKQTPEQVIADLGVAKADFSNSASNLDYIIESYYATDGSSYWQKYKSGLIVQGGVVTLPAGSVSLPVSGSWQSGYTVGYNATLGSISITLIKQLTKYGLSVTPMGNFTDLSHIILYNSSTAAITCRWEAKGY